MLTATSSTSISWTWSGETPDHWNIEESLDGITGWSVLAQTDGETLDYSPVTTGRSYRVIGADGDDVPFTPYSNVVVP